MLLNNFYGKKLPVTVKDIIFNEIKHIKVLELKRQLNIPLVRKLKHPIA